MSNILSQLVSSLSVSATASQKSRWLDGYCLVVDTSHYTTSIDWQALKDAGISFLWAKCSEGTTILDDRFAATVQEGYDADIPVGAYHFFDPSYLCSGAFGEEHWSPFNLDPNDITSPNQDAQLLNLKKALRFKKIYAIAIDLERWWVDYGEYYANPATARVVTPTWITATFERFIDAVRKTWPDKEVFIYSRKSFMEEYAKPILDTGWIKNNLYPIWTAQYIQPGGTVKTTWDEIKAQYLPADSVNPQVWGADKWDFWQWSGDCFMLDGFKDGKAYSAVDISFYNGTATHLWQRIGFNPKADPSASEEPESEPTENPELQETETQPQETLPVSSELITLLQKIQTDLSEIRAVFK